MHYVDTYAGHGVLSGDVFIADGRDVYIKKSGTIDGEITLGVNASLTQIIRTPDDITDINIADDYNIIVYRAVDLQWTDIQQISSATDKIVLVDSGIVLSPDMMLMTRSMPVPIELVGHNELHIKLADIDFNTPIFWRVTGSGTVHLHADDINPLYALRTVVRGGGLQANARIGLSLPDDDAIIYAGIGALHDKMGASYSATLSLSFNFNRP